MFWKTYSLWLMVCVIMQDSAPYRNVFQVLLLNSLIRVLFVIVI